MSSGLYSGSSGIALGAGLYASTAGLWSGGLGLDAAFGFNPSALFVGGVPGVWYDPSDLSTVWQDSARTTPGAVGQPVGCIDDKSGNGKHATQATAGNRPVLRLANGRYYLEFNGATNNRFLQSAALDMSASDKAFLCVGAYKNSDAANGSIFEFGEVGASAGSMLLVGPGQADVANYGIYLRGSTGIAGYVAATYTAPIANVISAQFDLAGAAIATEIVPRVNKGAPALSVLSAGPAGAGNMGNLVITIGRRFDTTQPFNGRFYGAIMVAGVAINRNQIDDWMNSKTGAY